MDGAIETTLTAAIPYASWRASERLSLWGAAGYGVGEMTLEPGDGESLRAGIGWSMAAAGLRSDLFSFAGGTKLDLISDALWASTGSERIEGLVATESAVSRLRLGVEASREFSLPGGGSLRPDSKWARAATAAAPRSGSEWRSAAGSLDRPAARPQARPSGPHAHFP